RASSALHQSARDAHARRHPRCRERAPAGLGRGHSPALLARVSRRRGGIAGARRDRARGDRSRVHRGQRCRAGPDRALCRSAGAARAVIFSGERRMFTTDARYRERMAEPTLEEREILTWTRFGEATRDLASEIALDGFRPDMVLAIARGGLT